MSRQYISRKTITKTDKKSKVQAVLTSISTLSKKGEFAKADGTLDFEKFHASEVVKQAVARLKEMKVDRDYLWENGFMAAAMTLPKF